VNTFTKRHSLLKILFHCKKLRASAPLREITVLTPVNRTTPSTTYCSRRGAEAQSEHIYQETSSPKNAFPLQKAPRLCARSQCLRQLTAHPPARRSFRAQAQGRKVNTFIKRQLLLKMLFYSKKLCASAPLREITVPTPVNRTTPITTYCSRRGAGAQSEHIYQETSSPKNALSLQKAPRLSASARDHSACAS
jgi:hypothetical protein